MVTYLQFGNTFFAPNDFFIIAQSSSMSSSLNIYTMKGRMKELRNIEEILNTSPWFYF